MTSLKKREFPFSPEKCHHLDHNCDHSCERIIIVLRCVLWFEAVVWSGLYRILLEIFPHVSSLKHEQREVVDHPLPSKNFVAIFPTGFGKILIYQPLCNVKGNANGANDIVLIVSALTQKEQTEDMEEIGIPSIVLPTKEDVLLPLVSGKRRVFGCNNPYKDSLIHN